MNLNSDCEVPSKSCRPVQPVSPHHNHVKAVDKDNQRKVMIAALLTASYMLVEIVGGWWVGSLALVADGVHMLTDAAALAIAWWGFHVSTRPPNARYTFGYQRFQIITAFVNALFLLVIVVGIIAYAIERFFNPEPIMGQAMFVIALVGLINNLIVFLILHSGDKKNMNMRGAALHFMGDTVNSVAVIAAAIVIYYTNWVWLDPLLSILVSLVIGYHAWNLLRESGHILMEGVPAGYELEAIKADLQQQFPFLTDIHHIHLWAIAEDQVMMSLHAKTDLAHINDATLAKVKAYLNDHHGVHHVTLQLESKESQCAEEVHDGAVS